MVFHENEETVFRYWINPITKEVTCQKGYHHHQKSVIKASHDAAKRKQFGTILLVSQQKFDYQTCNTNITSIATNININPKAYDYHTYIMYMQYIYHIAIRRERRVGTKNEEVTGTTDSQRPMTLGEFGSSAGQTRSDKLTREMKRKVDFSGKRREPPNTQNN